MDEFKLVFFDLISLVAIINPASKIFIVATMNPPCSQRQINFIARRTNLTAGLILVLAALIGHVLLANVFNIHMNSLQVAGGIVMFLIGLQMVSDKGNKPQDSVNFEDIAIVPLAAPMTAGPGSIAAVILLSSQRGIDYPLLGAIHSIVVIALALLINYFLMRATNRIGQFLLRFRLVSPLSKLTGLLVAAIAIEMLLSGLSKWLVQILQAVQTS